MRQKSKQNSTPRQIDTSKFAPLAEVAKMVGQDRGTLNFAVLSGHVSMIRVFGKKWLNIESAKTWAEERNGKR